MAYVIRRPNGAVDAEGLKAHALTQLARFKVPRDIVFVDDLPRTALGKVQHFMLRRLDAAEASQGVGWFREGVGGLAFGVCHRLCCLLRECPPSAEG